MITRKVLKQVLIYLPLDITDISKYNSFTVYSKQHTEHIIWRSYELDIIIQGKHKIISGLIKRFDGQMTVGEVFTLSGASVRICRHI